jgi:hypothetical protein
LLLSVKEGGTKLKIALTLQAKNEETAGAEKRKSYICFVPSNRRGNNSSYALIASISKCYD